MFRKMTKQSVHLPEEIIEEILSRLAVKPLLRLRCVSKSWRSLIMSKRFIKTQLQHSTKKTSLAHHRVIFCCKRNVTKQCSLHYLLNETEIDPPIIDIPTINWLKRGSLSASNSFRVVGCCNGLLCLLNVVERSFVLWNLATRISIKLPKVDLRIITYGFGLDEKSGTYNVFAVGYKRKPKQVMYKLKEIIYKVYSMNSNSWKIVKRVTFTWWPHRAGQFVCGKIHWFNNKGHFIESLDLGTEEFGRIEIPFNPYDCCDLQLGEIGGCLCVCDHHVKKLGLDVWVMKEYGVKESWSKLVSVPPLELELLTSGRYPLYMLKFLLGGGPNGEILFMYRDNLLVYYSKDNVFSAPKTIEDFGECYDVQVYVESLVSPVSNKNLRTIC